MSIALMLAVACLSPKTDLYIGFSRVDLIPPRPFSLGGYTARGSKPADEGGEPLYARVVRIKDDFEKIVIVSCDLLTIPESLVREVRAKIPDDVRLFLAATHTHSAPDSQMLNERMTFAIPGIAKYDPKQLNWYAETIASGINMSLTRETYIGSSIHADFAHVDANRGRRLGASPDQLATRIWASSEAVLGDTRLNLWFWYTAHATVIGSDSNRTSPDWPGGAPNWLSTSAVLVGAIGDASPKSEGSTSDQKISDYWRKTSERLLDQKLKSPIHTIEYRKPKLCWASEKIDLPPVSPNPEFAKLNKVPIPLANSVITKFAPTEGEISAFRIGKICVVGVPGEPTSALGRRIRDYGKGLGFDFVLTTSHVNGWIGYILEADDYARGGYEASLAFHGPETAQRVFEASARAMQKLAHPNRGVKSVSGVTSRQ